MDKARNLPDERCQDDVIDYFQGRGVLDEVKTRPISNHIPNGREFSTRRLIGRNLMVHFVVYEPVPRTFCESFGGISKATGERLPGDPTVD